MSDGDYYLAWQACPEPWYADVNVCCVGDQVQGVHAVMPGQVSGGAVDEEHPGLVQGLLLPLPPKEGGGQRGECCFAGGLRVTGGNSLATLKGH